jgi:3-oxoacyl-[acyl-carrier protein] reductase
VKISGGAEEDNPRSPSDIVYAILYLASDAARFVTGQMLRLNGGVAMP